MQSSQMQAITESQDNTTIQGVEKGTTKLLNEFCDVSVVKTGTQVQTFMSPSNSATSPFDTPPVATVDPVSSVVSLLKGSLEKKRLARQVNASEILKDTSFVISNIQPEVNLICNQNIQNEIYWPANKFHLVSSIQEQNSMNSKLEILLEPNTEEFVTSANQFRTATVSEEPSQSGSSMAVAAFSIGFDACDDLANSALPSDMQAVLKRSEALEKEVRSLKFNLSFMNRYGSFLSPETGSW